MLCSTCRFWKRVISTLFPVFLTACSAPSVWHVDAVSGARSSTHAARLTNRIDNSFRDIQLELLTIDGFKPDAFLNVFCIPLNTRCDGEFANTIFRWDDTEIQIALPLLTGGQRVHLPDSITTQIIEVLSRGESIDIEIERYRMTLYPSNFDKAYANFLQLSGTRQQLED
jgi:hypothetical protein